MNKKKLRISVLAALVDGEWRGEDVAVQELADLAGAGVGQLAYIDDIRKMAAAAECSASALIVPLAAEELSLPVIKVSDPAWAAAVIHNHLLSKDFVARGVDARAVVGEGCSIPDEVSVGPLALIGDRVQLGHRVEIKAGVVIGDGVTIGSDVLIHPNATILDGSIIGDRVIIHSGVVIGADGFGYAHDQQGRHVKKPHVGYVRIDDDVELGANVCVDRGTFGPTWIKRGVKIDNLVQIAHNVEIGEDSIIVSQSGIAGSTTIGRNVIMGGKVAVSGHLKIGNRVTMAGKAGVISDLEDGAVVAGFPAFAHKKWLRAVALFQKLPELAREVRELRIKLQELAGKPDDK
ncbi:MAG: UDP-3-O-(3-hydroxymyristoyl)glucosamine N-acyltransferase [Desulfurivibrionaceae bacterium]|nr:UDP-3-O-(3-hydroxymyristoyl)glucosamine N-acyltransferase [Desulfobulbales bacterium]MDT8335605.1 UDP-3-O-(3-hydroxymyristoyl)glucosamine N-acyltransferase [Desulfurivibrionaceae bacterium]